MIWKLWKCRRCEYQEYSISSKPRCKACTMFVTHSRIQSGAKMIVRGWIK